MEAAAAPAAPPAPAVAPETLHHAPQSLPPPSPLNTFKENLPEYHPQDSVPPLPFPETNHHGDSVESDSDDDKADDDICEQLWNISVAMETGPHPAHSDSALLAELGHSLSPHGRGLLPLHASPIQGGQPCHRVGLPLLGGGQRHDAVGLPLPSGHQGDAEDLHLGAPDHAGLLPDGQPHGGGPGWTTEELPAEEQIANMSYEELLKFAGGGKWR